MKILLISYFFPPYNVIGAVRTGKLAEYWVSQGHDVKVITAIDQPLTPSLQTSFPKSCTYSTKWLNVNTLPEKVLGGRAKIARQGYSSGSSFLGRLGRAYKTLLNFPDGQIGWYPFAVNAGKKIIENGWKPDLIYASAHPLTSLLIAKRLSVQFNVPWVAEFRDLWTDNQNYQYPAWRKWIEKKIESSVLSNISAAVTVSEPLAETLRKKIQIPITTILNGFDPNDYLVSGNKQFPDDKLNIVYTGMVYAGKQDPSPLFAALQLMYRPNRIHIHFYGRYLRDVEQLAEYYGVKDFVSISEAIPYSQALQVQMQSDVLLFLLWDDISERGIYTGKLFEYFGARHPILAIGTESGVAAELIQERNVGIISNNPVEISKQLEQWAELKISGVNNFVLPEESSKGLTRREQFSKLDTFLKKHNLL